MSAYEAPAPLRPPTPRLNALIDIVIALGLALAASAAAVLFLPARHRPAAWLLFPVVLAASLSLLWRRSHPRVVFAVAVAALVANGLIAHSPQVTVVPMLVALITLAQLEDYPVGIAGAAVAGAAMLVELLVRSSDAGPPGYISRFAVVAAATAVGLYLHTRVAYMEGLQERAAAAERERELRAERAVSDERARIARELHDVVAHHVSLLVVQAGAIRESLPEDAPARGVADQMLTTGRQALDEMRSMLGVLRAREPREPQPGAADVAALVEQARAAGLDVELAVEGHAEPLSPGVDLAAYRVVQEALTNIVKHAGPAHARVLVRHTPDAVEVRVTDDGRGADAPAGGGHGLVGLRERAALYGGEAWAGPVPGGGWAVRARLPR